MNDIAVRPNQALQISQQMQSASVAREIAQVQSQMIVAMQNPRNMTSVFQGIEQDCSRLGLASKAVYAYSKGGSEVKGPSIRLMEAVARSYRNIKYGFETVSQEESQSVVRAYAFDMETNCQAERIFTVLHVIHTRAGDKLVTDPREIYELVANNASRRVRACLIEVIPGDVVDYALDLCDKTIKNNVKINPETIGKLLTAFKDGYGVSKIQIEDFIQRKIEAVSTSQFLRLREIYASLNDGMSGAQDWFKPDDECKGASKTENKTVAEPSEERKQALKELENMGITADMLVSVVKNAKSIADVSDSFILETLAKEKGGAS